MRTVDVCEFAATSKRVAQAVTEGWTGVHAHRYARRSLVRGFATAQAWTPVHRRVFGKPALFGWANWDGTEQRATHGPRDLLLTCPLSGSIMNGVANVADSRAGEQSATHFSSCSACFWFYSWLLPLSQGVRANA